MFNECTIKAAEPNQAASYITSHYCHHRSDGPLELLTNVSSFDKYVLKLWWWIISVMAHLYLSDKTNTSSSLQQIQNGGRNPQASVKRHWNQPQIIGCVTVELASFWPSSSLFVLDNKNALYQTQQEWKQCIPPTLPTLCPLRRYTLKANCP